GAHSVASAAREGGEVGGGAPTAAQGAPIEGRGPPPIPTDGWTREDLNAAVARVQQLYVDTLEDWPTALRAEPGESDAPRSRAAAARAGQNRRTPIDAAGTS